MIKLQLEKRVWEPMSLEVTEEQFETLKELFDGTDERICICDVDSYEAEWGELEEVEPDLHDTLKKLCDENDYEIIIGKARD